MEVLCLLQDPFKQSKLSLKLTLTRGNCYRAVVAIIIKNLELHTQLCMLAKTFHDI